MVRAKVKGHRPPASAGTQVKPKQKGKRVITAASQLRTRFATHEEASDYLDTVTVLPSVGEGGAKVAAEFKKAIGNRPKKRPKAKR